VSDRTGDLKCEYGTLPIWKNTVENRGPVRDKSRQISYWGPVWDRFRSTCNTGGQLPRHVLSTWYIFATILVLWKNGSGFGACTSIDPKLYKSISGWPSGPQEKKRSTKRRTSHPLVPTSAFVPIRDIPSARFSTAPDVSTTKSGEMRGQGGYFSSLVRILSKSRDAARIRSGDDDS